MQCEISVWRKSSLKCVKNLIRDKETIKLYIEVVNSKNKKSVQTKNAVPAIGNMQNVTQKNMSKKYSVDFVKRI